MSDLIFENHFTLLHFLHSDYFTCGFDLTDANFSEGTSANDRKGLEVSDSDLFAPTQHSK